MDVAAFLSLLEDHPFRLGKMDVRFWSPNHLKVLSCKSLCDLADPSP